MRRIFFVLMILVVILLTGCAFMEELLIETQEIAATGEANPEIRATLTIIDDFVDNPWGTTLAVVIGYGLALLRRWYKKKMGSKTV